jgi:hypothetical protein
MQQAISFQNIDSFHFVLTHQSRVPDNVGEHNGSKLTTLRHMNILGFIEGMKNSGNV